MTSLRLILGALLLTGSLAAHASDAIPAPKEGVSASVSQPHVTAELISETTYVTSQPFLIALHLHMDPNWHTYWINPGDAGLPTTIKWTLPPGFTAGPIQWPTPELHKMGPLTTYGYAGDVYLLTTMTPPAKIGAKLPLEIKASADWLVCQEECIPGKGDFIVKLGAPGGKPTDPAQETFFAAAKARLPVPNTLWTVKASYAPRGGLSQPGQQVLVLEMRNRQGVAALELGNTYFFTEQENVVDPAEHNVGKPDPDTKFTSFDYLLDLQQNGEKAPAISGVLISDRSLGGAKSVYISLVPTDAVIPPLSWAIGNSKAPTPLAQLNDPMGDHGGNTGDSGHRPPLQTDSASGVAADLRAAESVSPTPTPWLITILGGAFLGGLILNLMPCVLPVLSLKVFSLMKHAGDDPRAAWKQGAAFTLGVVISFWILAGLLIALRAAGNHLGWGFQMQSPGFVLALIFLFFLLGLNLFGVFELGTSLVGLDAKTTGHVSNGLASSFLNGALATLAATPCTAPFMGSSVGFAAEQPASVAMLIFTVLALGMATPYLLLTIFPAALRFVPKPGAWMEAFKQFMGFLLMATVIFLLYVFGALVGQEQVPYLLAALLLAGVGAWIYGKWATPVRSSGTRLVAVLLALVVVGYAIWWGADLARATPLKDSAMAADGWQPWSTESVDQALANGQPVFVDFTAAWCLSCKVNESVALDTTAVMTAFKKKNVALFRADWTHSDPAISDILAKYHRDGVPLYLLYSPRAKDAPNVLPAVLTPGLVEDAVAKLP